MDGLHSKGTVGKSSLFRKYKTLAWKWKCQSFSHVQLFETPSTVVHQAPLSMDLSRQECWSGLPSPLQGIFLS